MEERFAQKYGFPVAPFYAQKLYDLLRTKYSRRMQLRGVDVKFPIFGRETTSMRCPGYSQYCIEQGGKVEHVQLKKQSL